MADPLASESSGVIVYVLSRYPQLSETFVSNEIAGLRRRGFQVRVIALGRGDTEVADGPADLQLLEGRRWSVRRLLAVFRARPDYRSRLLRLLVGQRLTYAVSFVKALPDLVDYLATLGPIERVHTHFAWAASSVGMYVSALTGRPLSITVHARDLYISPKYLQAKIDACDPLVTVCDYNRQWLADRNFRVDRLAVVPCGVQVEPVAPQERTGANLVGVGRLVEKKGFDLAVRALPAVRTRVPDVHLDLVGDGPERQRLESLARECGVADLVTFHGARPHAEALAMIDAATAFVLPCRIDSEGDSDALPVVLREAMARGAAVVSTTVAGIPETITPDTGWLVAPDDEMALADAISAVLTDPAERRRRVLAAHQRVLARYTIEVGVSELLQAWRLPPAPRPTAPASAW